MRKCNFVHNDNIVLIEIVIDRIASFGIIKKVPKI